MTVIVLDSGTRKARKAHKCFHCYRPIWRGEVYFFQTLKHDDAFGTVAMHHECVRADRWFSVFRAGENWFWDDGVPPLLDQIHNNAGQDDIDAMRGHFPHVACRLEFHEQKRADQ